MAGKARQIEMRVVEADRKGWRWQVVRGAAVMLESPESYRRPADASRAAGRFARAVYVQLVAGVGLAVAKP